MLAEKISNATAARLLNRDIDEIRSRDGIKSAVVSVLRELGLIPEDPYHSKRKPKLEVVPTEAKKVPPQT